MTYNFLWYKRSLCFWVWRGYCRGSKQWEAYEMSGKWGNTVPKISTWIER